jgi:release factor glutamine methyltransferase
MSSYPKKEEMDRVSQRIRQELSDIYSPGEIKSLTGIIWCEELGMPMLDIYLNKDINLSDEKEKKLKNILSRLKTYEPIQYIQGYAPFCGLRFKVAKGVLIPRPETEELVELIVKENGDRTTPDIVDMGTGSGCIAISLAKRMPGARVKAWELSDEAIDIATENNRLLSGGVTIVKRDILQQTATEEEESCDIIVSNPPYITRSEEGEMEHNVLDWEPQMALFVDDTDPLLFYRRIADHGARMLRHDGRIYFEINREYGEETAEMLRQRGYADCRIIKDISGNDRMVTARHI